MKWFKYFLSFVVAVYLLFCVGLYASQEKALFFPNVLPDTYTPTQGVEVWIPVEDDINIHSVHMFSPNSKGVILYLHGNRGDVRRCLHQTREFQNLGYDIFVPDYRGYGKSQGSIRGESQMYNDAQAVYDYLKQRYTNIVIVGYSMGSGLASYLAANNEVSSLLLIAPYISLVDMKNRYLPFVPDFILKYHFRTDQNLSKVSCPVALVHGMEDKVIPFESSEMLHTIHPKTMLTPLPNISHRQVIFNPAIGQTLRKLLLSE